MKVLLLSAGYGRRLRPLTKAIPKCLIPVNGKPLLQYWLDLLTHDENIDSIIINTVEKLLCRSCGEMDITWPSGG